jgi:hypothetical protein
MRCRRRENQRKLQLLQGGPQSKGNDTDDDGSLSHGLCFYFEGKFHPLLKKREEKWPRFQVGVLFKHSCKKKESRDSVDGGGYGNGTSIVLGEGKKLVVRK